MECACSVSIQDVLSTPDFPVINHINTCFQKLKLLTVSLPPVASHAPHVPAITRSSRFKSSSNMDANSPQLRRASVAPPSSEPTARGTGERKGEGTAPPPHAVPNHRGSRETSSLDCAYKTLCWDARHVQSCHAQHSLCRSFQCVTLCVNTALIEVLNVRTKLFSRPGQIISRHA